MAGQPGPDAGAAIPGSINSLMERQVATRKKNWFSRGLC